MRQSVLAPLAIASAAIAHPGPHHPTAGATPSAAANASVLSGEGLSPFPRQGAFTVVGLPDTQNYSESFPFIFDTQVDWTVENADALNLKFVSHFGDVVQHGTGPLALGEYINAEASLFPLLNSDIPFGICNGNHDVLESGTVGQPFDNTLFLQFFGPHIYEGKPFYVGSSPSGMSSAQLFSGGGEEFLAIHLSVDNPFEEIRWAHDVLAVFRDRPAMISTHRYIQDADDYIPDGLEAIAGLLVSSGRYPDIWYAIEGLYDPSGTFAEDFWRHFVRANRNIFWVNCGHFHEQHRQTSSNLWGLPVREVLADFQDDPNGGNGWLRLMEFDTAAEEVRVSSYSPFLDLFLNEAGPGDTTLEPEEGFFTYSVAFEEYASAGSVSFQEGVAGYAGTQDTWVNEDAGNTSYGESGSIEVDNDIRNSLFGDDTTQGLIRFEQLFTASGEAGKIPQGAQILEATLRIYLTDDVDIGDEDMNVFVANRDWTEQSTWNSLGSGLSGGELGAFLGQLDGDNSRNGDGQRILDVTAAVQAWAAGAPNFGFALLPEDTDFNDDGMTVASSENGNVFLRPALDVVFLVAEPCNPADVNRDGLITFADVTAFVEAFSAAATPADVNADGLVTFADVTTFVNAFNVGCP